MTATITTPADEDRETKGSIDSNSRCAAGTVYGTLRHNSLLTVKRKESLLSKDIEKFENFKNNI